ncbi:EF hand family protein [Cryptosporidium muris RN66]|uniref:EF hand family protein n=1 Tax=Cryptosporidium muris (strain RN66) TaxID=441375 RepID=B6AHD3_CRYMR|nr:EF hand family protein [Cryptosporidium muris RN66]EEA07628.1 EF hand family protein [Cryptosporidium muris RN66]|eukprot:XP_002141977.1 EF hand family protein [Cryptosporidium muris RN66]
MYNVGIKGSIKHIQSHSLTKEQLEDANNVFGVFDTNKDGFLDLRELKACLRALGFQVKRQQIISVVESALGNSRFSGSSTSLMDNSGWLESYSLTLNLEDFYTLLSSLMNESGIYGIGAFYNSSDSQDVSIDYVRHIFSMFDINKTGKISLRTLKQLVSHISKESQTLGINFGRASQNFNLFSDEELTQIVQQIDQDNDGYLDFQDFYRVFQYYHNSIHDPVSDIIDSSIAKNFKSQ